MKHLISILIGNIWKKCDENIIDVILVGGDLKVNYSRFYVPELVINDINLI